MPRIIRQGDTSLGHCWPPTIPIPQVAMQRKVYSQTLPIVVQTDQYLPHPGPCGPIPPHPVGTIIGSPNVFIGGFGILRDGDPLNCGDVANTFEGTVFCNGGGRGPSNRPDLNQTYGFGVSLPFVEYPPLIFNYMNRFITEENTIFTGCTKEPFRPTFYTNLTEEQTGAVYRNYTDVGAPTIPEYASDFIRNPIPLLQLDFKISTDGSPFQDIIGTDLGDGIKINKNTGEVFGTPFIRFTSKTLKVIVRNFVGTKETNFNISLAEVTNCP